MILYFSATGNTKWVAQQLSTFLCDNRVYDLTKALPDVLADIAADEPLGFCFPIHAWGIPAPVQQWIKQLSASISIPYLYMVCTCGDDCGTTAQQFSQLLATKGCQPQLTASVQMPNSYVNLPGFDVDSSALTARKKASAVVTVQNIAHRIAQRQKGNWVHEGSFPHLKSGPLQQFFQRYLVTDSYFHVTDTCIGCGACAAHCPVDNLRLNADHQPDWLHTGRCLTCMACYHYCPQHAIRFGKFTDKKGQYHFI